MMRDLSLALHCKMVLVSNRRVGVELRQFDKNGLFTNVILKHFQRTARAGHFYGYPLHQFPDAASLSLAAVAADQLAAPLLPALSSNQLMSWCTVICTLLRATRSSCLAGSEASTWIPEVSQNSLSHQLQLDNGIISKLMR